MKLKALNNGKDYKLVLNQSRVKIIENATVERHYEHKFISALNCGGLTVVKLSFQNIFLITEEKFRYATQQHLFSKDQNQWINRYFTWEETELISCFNSIVDTSGVDNFDDDTLEEPLHDMVNLYLRDWSYSLALDIVSKHKLTLKKKSSKALPKEIKKLTKKSQINECKENHIYKMGF